MDSSIIITSIGLGAGLFVGLIIFFLIIEPHGLNQLWRLIREKLIIWPFPH